MRQRISALFLLLLTTVAVSLLSGCAVGAAKYAIASKDFTPKEEYNVSVDKMWTTVRKVLEDDNIEIAGTDKESGKITTDYISGQTEMSPFGVLTTRYKYTFTISKTDSGKIKLKILTKVESMSKAMAWHDVSKDNPKLVDNLSNVMYEKIESKL